MSRTPRSSPAAKGKAVIAKDKVPPKARSARWEEQYQQMVDNPPPKVFGWQGLGARLRWARARKRIPADQLAQDHGVTKFTLLAHETGKSVPRCDLAERLAEALEVSIAWMVLGLGEHDDPIRGERS